MKSCFIFLRIYFFSFLFVLKHLFDRGRRNTYHHTTLLKIDGVNDSDASKFYFGKKVAFIYKAKVAKSASKFRVVWGKVTRGHANNGVVRAKFSTNLSVSTNTCFILYNYVYRTRIRISCK